MPRAGTLLIMDSIPTKRFDLCFDQPLHHSVAHLRLTSPIIRPIVYISFTVRIKVDRERI